jgi:transcriptional regulator with XRE-family HTH domain
MSRIARIYPVFNQRFYFIYPLGKFYLCHILNPPTMSDRTVHIGRNIKRIRELLGVKQDALAITLGDDWNQQKISYLEAKEEVDGPLLDQVAKALKVTPEVIKNFNEESAMNIISNTFSSHDNSTLHAINYQPTFNPVDKIVELYERMLKEKDAIIERLLSEKKGK